MPFRSSILCGAVLALAAACATATPQAPTAPSELAQRVIQFDADRGALRRYWSMDASPRGQARQREFLEEQLASLARVEFETLTQEARVDWVLLRNEIEQDLAALELARQRHADVVRLAPYFDKVLDVIEPGQRLEPVDPAKVADAFDALLRDVKAARKAGEEQHKSEKRSVLVRAAGEVSELQRELSGWVGERAGYDPLFTWWVKRPADALGEELGAHARQLREELAGLKPGDEETIVGDPLGREALLAELVGAMIPYSPEELLEIADRELAWCEREFVRAAQDMGLGDDWRAALERVKQDHVGPGEQPQLIRELADEAIRWVEERELVTVPELAKETWRMEMMTPSRQLVTPFFTGGEVISVSFPTDGMEHEKKEMSQRGNNRHFSRATVHHELIPGHHLQQFMQSRYATHRRSFASPFWTEGWALWWELLMWERGFQRSPENRIGMLFWRAHRCARIRFSLSFHLGLWTPEQCIDFLVERIGHERENAAGEVRRSFNGSYGPLYQIAYMVGALQLRELHRELCVERKLPERDFHDAVLQGGSMPIEMVRARLAGTPLTPQWRTNWRFYEAWRK
ncbi:MAG: DUF885 family protein [Planctomycetaceae bacterium]|nr:DUF885 family protein [Planctomycetaceae bacterium]